MLATRSSVGILIFALVILGVTFSASLAGRAGPATAAFLNAGQFNSEKSMSGGIQEALDALPPEGGTVMVPPGTHILRRPIILKRHAKLVGAGRSTVLKKDAAFIMKVTEDVKKGQNYIVVEDASKLKIGACLAAGDRAFHPTIGETLIITNISGNKVFFYVLYPSVPAGTYPAWLWEKGLAVARGACAMNLFVLIVPAQDTLVMDLELDGNAAEQRLDFLKTGGIFESYGMLWSGLYPAQGKVERCWIHDCGIGVHVNGLTGIEIRNCEVYRNIADGIHCGGGPHSLISNNRIYENGAGGISFCYGNRKLIITGNEIMRNQEGIKAMGSGEETKDTTADRYTIVSRNIIYENARAGLTSSGQGRLGPADFVFTDNIIQNNQQDHYRSAAPAGIMFANPKRCVISNNRCFDDRAAFPRYMLAEPVAAGASNVTITFTARVDTHSEPYFLTNDWLRIGSGSTAGVYTVVSIKNQWVPFLKDQTLQLNQPVPTNLPAETPVSRVAAQKWGIAILGEEAEGNVIAGNVCAGNGSGGMLVKGLSNNIVADNVGRLVPYDEARLPVENYFPALGVVAVANAGFENDTAWNLTKDRSAYDGTAGAAHSGKRALKLTHKETGASYVADATASLSALHPNCRYRLTAWVRTNAKTRDGAAVLPHVLVLSKSYQLLGGSNPGGFAQAPAFAWSGKAEPDQWYQVGLEFLPPALNTEALIYCRLDRGAGEAWVDDLVLEEIEKY